MKNTSFVHTYKQSSQPEHIHAVFLLALFMFKINSLTCLLRKASYPAMNPSSQSSANANTAATTPPSDVPPKELKPAAPDFPVTEAAEEDAGAELDVVGGVDFATVVVGADVIAEDAAVAVLAVVVAGVMDVLAAAVLNPPTSLCTEPVPVASWCGDGKHWIG